MNEKESENLAESLKGYKEKLEEREPAKNVSV